MGEGRRGKLGKRKWGGWTWITRDKGNGKKYGSWDLGRLSSCREFIRAVKVTVLSHSLFHR